MAEKMNVGNAGNVGSFKVHDAVVDGVILSNVPSKMVYVSGESELADLAEEYPVGTIAAQYGYTMLWQLAPTGWVEIFAQPEEPADNDQEETPTDGSPDDAEQEGT